jgi:excinuclease ABC subunit A
MLADRWLQIKGARTHHLKNLSVDIPLNKLVAVVGRSGSGKGSLLIHTVHAESQRRYLGALEKGAFRLGTPINAPPVDDISELPPTVLLSPPRSSPHPTGTLGTASGADPLLRVLVSTCGTVHCPNCNDTLQRTSVRAIIDTILALPEGQRITIEAPLALRDGVIDAATLASVASAGFSRVRLDDEVTRIEVATPGAKQGRIIVDRVKVNPDRRSRIYEATQTAYRAGNGALCIVTEDVVTQYTQHYRCLPCGVTTSRPEPKGLNHRSSGACITCEGRGTSAKSVTCRECLGTRRSPHTGSARVAGMNISQLAALSLSDLQNLIRDLAHPAAQHLSMQLASLESFGLGAHPLDTSLSELSTGEWQRARLSSLATQQLTGLMVIIDEPMSGLGVHESAHVARTLRLLVDHGNTVVVLLHWLPILPMVDWVLELGPLAGDAGGTLIHTGTPESLAQATTPTAKALQPIPVTPIVDNCTTVTAGKMIVLSGASGSGKSRHLHKLAAEAEATFQHVTHLNPYGGNNSKRSTPATLIGLWSTLRDLLARTKTAKVLGLSASDFSLNRPGGRCEPCQGDGVIRVDLGPLPPVYQNCEACDGSRFQESVRAVQWHGLSPENLLRMTATAARKSLSGHPKLARQLQAMTSVGLGYLPLGQPAHSWSTGESRRLRIARTLAGLHRADGQPTALFIDDPTAGLHPIDALELLETLRSVVDAGHALVVATHDPLVLAAADGILEMDGVSER